MASSWSSTGDPLELAGRCCGSQELDWVAAEDDVARPARSGGSGTRRANYDAYDYGYLNDGAGVRGLESPARGACADPNGCGRALTMLFDRDGLIRSAGRPPRAPRRRRGFEPGQCAGGRRSSRCRYDIDSAARALLADAGYGADGQDHSSLGVLTVGRGRSTSRSSTSRSRRLLKCRSQLAQGGRWSSPSSPSAWRGARVRRVRLRVEPGRVQRPHRDLSLRARGSTTIG